MATGWQTYEDPSKRYRVFRLVEGATSDVVAPTTASDGVELPDDLQALQGEKAYVLITDRSGTGTLTIAFAKLWGYLKNPAKWTPPGTGADTDRGKLNDAAAIGEVANDDVRLFELVFDLAIFDRLAVELNGVGGTNPVYDIDLLVPRHLNALST